MISSQGRPALVTFVTAGFPTTDDTVPILLSMQKGGADVIELGVPFSDPIADGPVIQESNTVGSEHSLRSIAQFTLVRSLSKTMSSILQFLDYSGMPAPRGSKCLFS
jgi:tryptophan synthase alpha subunit